MTRVVYMRVNLDDVPRHQRLGWLPTPDRITFQSSSGSKRWIWMFRDFRGLMFVCDDCNQWWYTENPEKAKCTCGTKGNLRSVQVKSRHGHRPAMLFICEECGVLDQDSPYLRIPNNEEPYCLKCHAEVDEIDSVPSWLLDPRRLEKTT